MLYVYPALVLTNPHEANTERQYTGGSFQGHQAISWLRTAALPAGLDTKTGAAAFVSGLTALTFLRESYEVKKGDTILVHAAAGGLGLQLTQVSNSFATEGGMHLLIPG